MKIKLLFILVILNFFSGCGTYEAGVLTRRGLRRQQNDNHEMAVRWFSEALEYWDSEYEDAFLLRGYSLYKLGKYSEAESDLNKGIQIVKDQLQLGQNTEINQQKLIHGLVNRASVYQKMKKLDLALSDYEEAIQLDDGNPDLLLNVEGLSIQLFTNAGDLYMQLNRFDESSSCYKQAMKLNSDNEHLLCNYAWSLLNSPKCYNPSLAIKYGEKALRLEQSAYAYGIVAAAYAELGQFEKAQSLQKIGIEFARKQGEMALVKQGEECLARYKSGLRMEGLNLKPQE